MEHAKTHGYQEDFLLKKNVNEFYMPVAVLKGWRLGKKKPKVVKKK